MNLARTTKLPHKLGNSLNTPLLVPSFSSKGLQFIQSNERLGFSADNKDKVSVASEIIASTSEIITDTALVSAFDISQGFIPSASNLPIGNIELMFVDSGGYETSNYYDLSELFEGPPYKHEWSREKHFEVLKKWPEQMPSVFVSYDTNDDFKVQLEEALKLCSKFPNQLSTFLIKPEKPNNKMIPLKDILLNIEELKHFDIIGVTEKELGHSTIKRMENIAAIRKYLDKAGINAPIHVFGSLDPITTCLYFFAGAEIFDGLTWSRMSYLNGFAIYKANYGTHEIGIQESDDNIKVKTLWDNLYYLKRLQEEMEEFAKTNDFTVFKYHSEFFKKSFKTLISKIN
ncbi:hypothetical protein AB9K26_14525 [Psychroserpens sp. XS_ASV72]|uniref:hypothetical protein n=1 Tax=Psychroserpens sp. XS_ASV72 TaxID=3241293 RepID=UPI003513CA90